MVDFCDGIHYKYCNKFSFTDDQIRTILLFLQSFIHPPLARWVWSTGRNENLMFSPFRFCNGTRTVEKDHRLSNYSDGEDLGDFVFIDFAGSGVVHLCGKLILLPRLVTITFVHI